MAVCRFVFFFKQKPAYEMRISDWSSDVCSSDLTRCRLQHPENVLDVPARGFSGIDHQDIAVKLFKDDHRIVAGEGRGQVEQDGRGFASFAECLAHERSEEHTSELQSLMRISYAVFCLKKKKIICCIPTQQDTREN